MEWVVIIGLGWLFYGITGNIYATVALEVAAIGVFLYLMNRYGGWKAVGIVGLAVLSVFGIVSTADKMKKNRAQKAQEAEDCKFALTEEKVRAYAEECMPIKWNEYNAVRQKLVKLRQALKDIAEGCNPEWFVNAMQEVHAKEPMADARIIKSKATEYLRKLHTQCELHRKELLEEIVREWEVYEAERQKHLVEAEAKRKEEMAKIKARELNELEKYKRIKDFAIKEAPDMWRTYEVLKAEVESTSIKLAELKDTLVSFDVNPDADADYVAICEKRSEMAKSCETLYSKMQQAYLQSCKFAATPGKDYFDGSQNTALEEGIKEAEAAMERYRIMLQQKRND